MVSSSPERPLPLELDRALGNDQVVLFPASRLAPNGPQGLHDLGWVEGRNILIEVRFAEGRTDQLPGLAAELVRLKIDVIVTSTTPAALAATEFDLLINLKSAKALGVTIPQPLLARADQVIE